MDTTLHVLWRTRPLSTFIWWWRVIIFRICDYPSEVLLLTTCNLTSKGSPMHTAVRLWIQTTCFYSRLGVLIVSAWHMWKSVNLQMWLPRTANILYLGCISFQLARGLHKCLDSKHIVSALDPVVRRCVHGPEFLIWVIMKKLFHYTNRLTYDSSNAV